MKHRYGYFTCDQIKKQKDFLHNSVHWLLINKEQNYKNLDKYIETLLYRISGMNDLFNQSPTLVSLLSVIQAIRTENQKEDCDFDAYRKLVFEAHSLIDLIEEG